MAARGVVSASQTACFFYGHRPAQTRTLFTMNARITSTGETTYGEM